MKVGEEEQEKTVGSGTARKQQQSQQRQLRMMGVKGGGYTRPGQQKQRTKSGGGASNKPILLSRRGKPAPVNRDEGGPSSSFIERRDGGGNVDSLVFSAVGPPDRPSPALVRKMTSTSAIYSSEDTSIDEAELIPAEQRPVPESQLMAPPLPQTAELHLIPVVLKRRNSIIDIIQAQNEKSREAGIYW